jgi:flagellar basal-body rod protein FlgB
MLNKISSQLDFFQRSLNLRAAKAEVIASNIANADTPGYKAVDFDFGKTLKSQTEAQQSHGVALAQTDGRHLAASGSHATEGGLQYRSAVQRSLDGNTVDMDVERSAFTDNALKYQSTLTFLNKRISGLMEAIKGGQ